MKYSAIDYTCLVCRAGTEVTSDPMTGRTLYREIPCRCPPKVEIPMGIDSELYCGCGKEKRPNAKVCRECRLAAEKAQRKDYDRRRTEAARAARWAARGAAA